MSNHTVLHPRLMGADPQRSTIYRMRRWVLPLLAVSLFSFLTQPLHAQSPASADSIPEEAYLNFSYSLGLVNTVVTAVYIEPVMYLPMRDIFNLLKVNYKFDKTLESISGFYITENRTYEIDFRTGKAHVDTAAFILRPDEFVRSTFDVYVKPGVLERLFGLHFDIDMGRLTLSLETDEELPVIAERNRERQRRMIESSSAEQAEYPLLYPRSKKLFDGGFLDYSLTAATTKEHQNYNYDLRGGGIIAGGDLELSANGSHNTSMTSSTEIEGRWRYVIDENPYITNVIAGYVQTDGLFPRSFKGIQASNEPVQVRTMYRSYVIEQTTSPEWTVELYLNERLVGVTKADGLGRYRFIVPLTYGTTNYSLRIYGPTGEMKEERQRIQIPFSFIPSGEINYTVSGGVLHENDDRFVQASVMAGLTSWLTSKAGIEFIDDTLYAKPVGSLSLSSWLEKNYVISIDAAPGALYRADLNAVYASQVSAGISAARYEKNEYYNPSHIKTGVQTTLSIPLMLASTPVTYRFQANRQNYEHSTTTFIATGTTISYRQINGTIEYRLSELKYGEELTVREPVLSTAILYSFSPFEKLSSLTTNILIGSSFIYNLERERAGELRLDLSSNVTPSGRIQFSYTRDFIRDQYTASVQFIYEFPFTRTTSTAAVDAEGTTAIQNVRGTVGYDSQQKIFHPHNLESVGRSALTLRAFVDKNGNGIFDPGEQPVNNVSYTMEQVAYINAGDSGITYIRQLLPYTRYNITIVESSISNPLLIPKVYAFSTITDPDVYKTIDIPFYASGVLEGTVFMQAGNTLQTVPGVEIHIRSISGSYQKSIRIFADGSFYQMGVPPGKYIAYVDSIQLGILGASCEPPVRPFDVKITAEGDYVEGVNFILKKDQTIKSASAIMDSAREISTITVNAYTQEYIIRKTPKGYIIQSSAWDTKRKAETEARRLERIPGMKTYVEKVIVDGKTKYTVRSGFFSIREKAASMLRKIPAGK